MANLTMVWLAKNAPDLSASVKSGAMSLGDAFSTALRRRSPMRPNFGAPLPAPTTPTPKWLNSLTSMGRGFASAVMAPGNALMGNYPAYVDPSAPGGVDPYSAMIPDAMNLAGLVTLGAGAAPAEPNAMNMGFRSRYADGLYHRFTRGPNPDNGRGFMMFADNSVDVDSYGKYHHVYDGANAVEVEKVAKAAKKAGFEKQFGYSVDLLDPKNIVETAGAWDDPDAVDWLWSNVLEPKGWHGVSTKNGAVVFDPGMVKTLGAVGK